MGKLINRKQYNINIPKIIHKIWFTKEPEKDLPYVVSLGNESVKKYCKDYQVITWNENNFDINISKFTRETYDTCLYGVMSDYVRLWALYNWGGIYLDSDVEILKPIDDLLNNDVFFGFEHENNTPKFVGTAIIGAKPKHPIIKTLLDYYENVNFITKNESLKIEQSNYKWPEILKKYWVRTSRSYLLMER